MQVGASGSDAQRAQEAMEWGGSSKPDPQKAREAQREALAVHDVASAHVHRADCEVCTLDLPHLVRLEPYARLLVGDDVRPLRFARLFEESLCRLPARWMPTERQPTSRMHAARDTNIIGAYDRGWGGREGRKGLTCRKHQ
jgi:hypothetical protein